MTTGHSMMSSLSNLVTQPGDRACSKEGQMGLQATRHVLVDAHAVLSHAVVSHAGAQHGVPGPVFQQQAVTLDVDHPGHMLVPAVALTASAKALEETLVADCGLQHGVPGAVLQQQAVTLDVDHPGHVKQFLRHAQYCKRN